MVRTDVNFQKRKIPKAQFLSEVKTRLENDVGAYFSHLDCCRARGEGARVVGFWGGLRLLLPVVDALADVLMGRSCHDKRSKPVRFMERYLEIKYPELVWEMYRHALIHGDVLRTASYRGNNISWTVSLGSDGHEFCKGRITLDVNKLYDDLISFLDGKIPKASGYIYETVGVKFKNRIRASLKGEFRGISSEPEWLYEDSVEDYTNSPDYKPPSL